jgi:hypothetical protein
VQAPTSQAWIAACASLALAVACAANGARSSRSPPARDCRPTAFERVDVAHGQTAFAPTGLAITFLGATSDNYGDVLLSLRFHSGGSEARVVGSKFVTHPVVTLGHAWRVVASADNKITIEVARCLGG